MSSVSPNPAVAFHSSQSYSQCPFFHSLLLSSPHDLPNVISFSPRFSLCYSHTGLLTAVQFHQAASHTRDFTLAFPLPRMFFFQIAIHMANSLTTFGVYSNIIFSEVCPVPPHNLHWVFFNHINFTF